MTEPTREQVFEQFDKSNVYIPEDGTYKGVLATDKTGKSSIKADQKNFQVRFALAETNGDGTPGRWVWGSLSTKNPYDLKDNPDRFEGAKTGLGITSRTLKVFDKTVTFKDKSDWSSQDLTDFTAAFLAKFNGLAINYATKRRVLETGEPDLDNNGNQRYNVYIRSLA